MTHPIQNNFNIPATIPILVEEENQISSEAIKAIKGLGIVLLLAGGICITIGLYVPAIALLVGSAAALIFGFMTETHDLEHNEPSIEAPDNIYHIPEEDEKAWEKDIYVRHLPRVVDKIKRIRKTPGLRKLGVLVELKIITPYALANVNNKYLKAVSQILRYSLLKFNGASNMDAKSNLELYRIIFSSLSLDQKQRIREIIKDASLENSKLSGMLGQDIPQFAAREFGLQPIQHASGADQILDMPHPRFPSQPHMIEYLREPILAPFDWREL